MTAISQTENQHPRVGKTYRDHKSGAHAKHLRNKEQRKVYNQAMMLAQKQGNRGRELTSPL